MNVTRGLDRFDRASLREGAAALMLWPGNADRHAALQKLVDALAAEPDERGGQPITAADWEEWLASEDASALQATRPDGIHDSPPVFEAALLGTRQELLGGRLEFPGLHYRLWMDALADGSDPHLEAGQRLLTAAVATGSRVIEFAGLSPGGSPQHRRPNVIAAPPPEEYERLRLALRLELEDPEATAPFLEPLQRGLGSDPWRPLSRESEDLFLLADPWHFSLAALVHAVAMAARSPELDAVLERVRRGARAVVVNAVEEMGWTVERVEEDHLVACPDRDCRVLIAVAVLAPDPAQLAAESVRAEADLFEWYERTAALARSLGASHSLLALIADGRSVEIDPAHPCFGASDESDPWFVGVGELQVMGEALRLDRLALPAALRSISRPPWPENLNLVDVVGLVRQREEARREAPRDPVDGTEYMSMCAAIMASRHTVPAPDLSAEIEVSRWEGIEDPAIFRSRESDEFALCVRSPARYLWVTCPATLERRHELLPTVAAALAFWLAHLCKAGFLLAPAAAGKRVFARFELELDRRPGPQLASAPGRWGPRLLLGAGFVEALCRGDNDADRMLVGAALEWAKELGHPQVDLQLDEIVPAGRGTALVWPDPRAEANPPRLAPPPPIEQRAREEVERSLASRCVPEGQVMVASGPQLEPVLEEMAGSLEGAIQAAGESLEPSALRDLVALHERAVFQSKSEAVFLPARSAISAVETNPHSAEDVLYRELALRILIERFSALPPRGSKPFSLRVANALRAATELQLELLGALESVRWEGAGGEVIVSPERGIVFDLGGNLPAASEAMRSQMTASAPDRMAEAHAEWWGEETQLASDPVLDQPRELEGNWERLDGAMREEWGVGFEQMVRLLRALEAMADEGPDCVASSPAGELEGELARRTRIPADAVAAAVRRVTLGPRPGYDTSDEEHQPGRANRERSYMRCPLVVLPGGELCWSSLHCRRSAEYLVHLIQSGRLQGPRPLSNPVTWISQELDREFEDVVLERVRGSGWMGRPRLTRLAGKELRRRRGEPIGDIDVLAWSQERREVWLLDSKRLAPGVEPGPMLREGESFEEHVRKHEERLRWVRSHLPELAREIGSEDLGNWEVRAALVLDRPLAGAYLKQFSMPIWTHWSLPRELNDPPSGDELEEVAES